MKTLALVFATLLIMLFACSIGTAQQTSQPAVAMSDTVSVTGTIVAIDKTDREVTVQGPQGNAVDIEVDPSVRNFDQLRVGDKVNMTYYEAVAVSIGPKGQLPSVNSSTMVGRGPAGSKPEGYVVETTDVVATIKSIDSARRVVTLQGPSGNTFDVKVPQDMQRFDQLKVGDSVNARYTEALAISVQKP
ncbi:MAG: hypothetical protein ABFD54_08840 [Armatimonadota bacterium]|nr:hypothetical protein [bacterium]